MTFSDQIATQAAEHHAENVARLRKQAAKRAKENGIDSAFAESEAERRFHCGVCREELLTEIAGPYQRKVAA
jgi:hypothetical protein